MRARIGGALAQLLCFIGIFWAWRVPLDLPFWRLLVGMFFLSLAQIVYHELQLWREAKKAISVTGLVDR